MMTFLKLGDVTQGPYTLIDLKFQIKAGRVSPDVLAKLSDSHGWVPLGELHPNLFSHEQLQQLKPLAATQSHAGDPKAKDKLHTLYGPLLLQMENRWSGAAHPTSSFYAHRVVTSLIQRLRVDLLEGGKLNGEGIIHVTRISAYLASIVIHNWERRGLNVQGEVRFSKDVKENKIKFWVQRRREGKTELYGHDFLKDTFNALLRPRQMFPYMHNRFYSLESLTLPSPEYLYLLGTAFMSSPLSFGNWPRGETVGCLKSDFDHSRNILIDDLHEDCGLSQSHPGYRQLSWWLVFPPYGWEMNEGGDYNIQVFLKQVFEEKVVSREEAVAYLRALLNCQGIEIRNLAARCLMILSEPPLNSVESLHYWQSMVFRDYAIAEPVMEKYQSELEGIQPNEQWRSQVQAQRQRWIEEVPPILSLKTAAHADPLYIELENQPPKTPEEGTEKLKHLMSRYPEDWILKVIYASQLFNGQDPVGGEKLMKDLIADPADSFEGHSRYGTWLKYSKGRRDEAFSVYEDALRRWPWCQQASDACLWMLTEGMVSKD